MAINAGTVYSELVLDIKKYKEGMEKAEQQMSKFVDQLKKAGEEVSEKGKKLTAGITLPLVGLATMAVKTSMDFEAAMSEVAAIAGATGEDLKALTEKAKEMGATTKFSATDAAAALKFMGQAGWTTRQMLEGIDGVMLLAAASGEDLATVSSIVTDSLTAFGMKANEARRFADLLAKAANATNTDVTLLGESFKYVAPLFGTLGYSAEDAALALGLMANAGIKGSQAGTSLRAAISRLVKPVGEAEELIKKLGIRITDAKGNTLPFLDVMEQLRKKFSKLTQEQQAQYAALLFGQEAMSGMLAIINASEEDFKNLTEATRNYTGEAQKMADIMQRNLKGQFIELQSKLEGLAIQIGDLLAPHISKLVDLISKAVDWFAKLDVSTQSSILQFAALSATVGPTLIVFGKLVSGISSIVGLFGSLGGAATTATGAISGAGAAISGTTLLLNPFTIAIGAAAAGGIALANYLRQDAVPAVDLFGKEISETTKESLGGFLELQKGVKTALDELYWGGKTITEEVANEIIKNIQEMGSRIITSIEQDKTQAIQKLGELMSTATGMTKEEQQAILTSVSNGYNQQTKIIEENMNKQVEIIRKALEEKRQLTTEERQMLEQLQLEMQETAIRIMTETELEHRLILEKMKQNAEQLTAEQAAAVVKNSIEQKNKVVAEAEAQYNETLKWIILQRDSLKTISEEQANALIEAARRQKEETIKEAELMHDRILTYARAKAGEHVNLINWETGEVKKNWELLAENIHKNSTDINRFISELESTQQDKFLKMRLALYEANKAYQDTLAQGGTILQAITAYEQKLDELEKNQEDTKQKLKAALEEMRNDSCAWRDVVIENIRQTMQKKIELRTGMQLTKEDVTNAYKGMAEASRNSTSSILANMGEIKIDATELKRMMDELSQKSKINFGEMATETTKSMNKAINKMEEGIETIHVWNATHPQKKTFSVIVETIEKIKRIFTEGFAEGTNFFKGGIGLVGEKGQELALLPTGQLVWLGVRGPQFVGLPVGTKIFSHAKSMELARMMNIPTFQEGGIVTSTGRRAFYDTDIFEVTPIQGTPIIIEQMIVRDDLDIYLISRELYNLQKAENHYKGRK